MLQGGFDGTDDTVERISQGFQDLIAGNGKASRNPFCQVPSLDFHYAYFGAWKCRADFLLDQFGGDLADQHAVVAAYVIYDSFIELVSPDPHGIRVNDASQRYHPNFR